MNFTTRTSRIAKQSAAFLLALGAMGGLPASAQPTTTVRVLVGFPPGGGADALARRISEALAQKLGQTFIVDNRPGAGGKIAAMELKRAAPDGRTLFLSNDHTIVMLPLTTRTPGFDPSTDFIPVGNVAYYAIGLAVHPSTHAGTLGEFTAWAKQRSDAAIGVPAAGSGSEFAASMLSSQLRVQATPVAYKGGAPMMTDLLGGQVPAGITALSEVVQYHATGKVKILAVSGKRRWSTLPDVPTFAEQGIQRLDTAFFLALYAPAGTPAEILKRYGDALREVLATAALREKISAQGLEAGYANAADVARETQRATQVWKQAIQETGFTPQ